ncbi:motility protein A [Turicibacter sanguinis]|uniref:motility protein A n=1 Tax=Turicibacter sanguinis TaxID=154288 RepID=UPI0018AC2101|nr:motility protein A [Turicibacter sanguinis]MDB8551138.1 motility protein A [Turicibacter sanguinis]
MKKNMFPLISMVVGIGVVFFGIMDSGGNVMMFISVSSLLIVLGGSLAALAIIYPLNDIKKLPKILGSVIAAPSYDLGEIILLLEDISQKARKGGVLSLESEVASIEDQFLQKGLQLVIDGSEADEVQKILTTEIDAIEMRHENNQAMISKWGALAPGFGMIGTVIGLIIMLGNLSTDPTELGAGMATALITTFYGSFFSNLLFDPIAANLAMKTAEEVLFKNIMMQGIVMIQSGANPRLIKDSLVTYLPPAEREALITDKE